MAARAIDLERIDRFLGTERQIDDALERLRDLWCDLVWAGDDMASILNEGGGRPRQAGVETVADWLDDLSVARGEWQSVGGQTAIDAFDSITDEIWRLIEEKSA